MANTLHRGLLGAALDIGTADIKGSLLDISSGRELAEASVPNEQRAFGQDVITRLNLAKKKEGMKELNKKVISAVNKLLKQLAKDASCDTRDIKKIIAVGNSAMYHLVLMIKPGKLAEAPFTPTEKKLQERDAKSMGLDAGKGAIFKFLPNISGFVGSDILAAIMTAGIHKDKRYGLIMDMGTNGEIALGCGDKIFVASCASGPAFEGRHIRCGMAAREGAIIRAKATSEGISFKTIGEAPPKGISGSGLIDLISILLDRDIIDRKGRMKSEEFVIYKGKGKKIYLVPKDIRQVQLAKAALQAGIEVLRRRARIALKDLDRFYITGTFGAGIDKSNAGNIGLVPKEVSLSRVKFLKKGALWGAKEVLLEPSREKEIHSILAKCEHVELHKDKEFADIFANSMHF
jgi:uncharacterized 2Fe-2S/4Fe-4S cluster protein (DUF4445 family)